MFALPVPPLRLLVLWIAGACLGGLPGLVRGEPIGRIETYALASDREAFLEELLPGSEPFYYYHCLHYQVTGQLAEAEAMLQRWENDPLTGKALRQGIQDRQRLLTFGSRPDQTVQYLRQRLGLQWNHAAPPTRGERRYPEALDAQLLAPQRLIEEALRSDKRLRQPGLRWLGERLLSGAGDPLPVDLRWLLEQVDGPWIGDLDALVIAELEGRRPADRRFGDLPAHRFLTADELQRVAAAVPAVATSEAMVAARLLRLRPDADRDPGQQPAVRHAYLVRADAYVTELPPAYNSLKAAILYRLLAADWARGEPQRERFIRYLQLPRQSPVVPPQPRRDAESAADLNQDFRELALVRPIGDERDLVRRYLETYLREAASPAAFADWIRSEYLQRVFAETKLLAGIGSPERWYRQLDPARQQQLKDRVELTLVEQNPRRLPPDEPASLALEIKHVDQLVIRMYELNTASYYRTHQALVHADIDLDGLVPTHERRIDYPQAPVRRHRERIELPEIAGRSVWVVDLLGGGLRTRALLRRGDLRLVQGVSPDGLRFTALDEDRQPVPTARLLLGSQTFPADDQGRITVPLLDQAVEREAILLDDRLAVPVRLSHPSEAYRLEASLAIQRQQLLPGKQAQLIVRPRLEMSGQRVSASLLKQAAVEVTVTDSQGITSRKRFDDLTFDERTETVLPFRVPQRLTQVAVKVSGEIVRIADGRRETLATSAVCEVNETRQSDQTVDGFLTHDGQGWVFETRGRNGEAVPAVSLQCAFRSRFRERPVEVTLQSDAAGVIRLGELPGIEAIRYQAAGAHPHVQPLVLDEAAWPSRLHATTEETVQLPLAAAEVDVARRFRLLSLRADRPAEDQSERLTAAAGLLSCQLPAGDYALLDHQAGRRVSLAVTAGEVRQEVAVGSTRHLEQPRRDPLSIRGLRRDEAGLRIELAGETAFARVHLFASRYLPAESPLSQLREPARDPATRSVFQPANEYLSGLKLGEEYQYVLRRQQANKYVGVMLPPPSLLLNPWATETTTNENQQAKAGERPRAAAAETDAARQRRGGAAGDAARAQEVSLSFDFLAEESLVLANLLPDEEGVVQIDAAQLAAYPLLQVVVTDPATTVQRTVAQPAPAVETRDRRLATALTAARPLAFERGVQVAGPDQPLTPASLGTAQVQPYESVAELLELYITLVDDPRLAAFRPLGRWHTLDQAAKRATYGELASHELHLFLRQYDPAFFAEVVKPYLAQKKEKQLIDHWLLGDDLTAWTSSTRYQPCNAFERALLAREVPAARPAILRELRERVDLLQVAPEILERLIESGLAGKRLEGESVLRRERALGEAAATELGAISEALGLGGMGGRAMGRAPDAAAADDAAADDAAADDAAEPKPSSPREHVELFFGERQAGTPRILFQRLDATRQYAESHWDRVRVGQAAADLIPLDPFWLDWAEAEGSAAATPAVSTHLLRPTTNRHAALVALAFSGLPLQGEAWSWPEDPETALAPPQPVALIRKRLQALEPLEGEATVLVGQRFETIGASPPPADSEAPIAIAPDEFLVQQGYLGQVVITNPTPQPRTVEVLWQLPAGSLPLRGEQPSDSQTLRLKPFAVEQIPYHFYFPQPGVFSHYPVCVSRQGRVLARGQEREFQVRSSPTTPPANDWPTIAREGDAEAIATFLAGANLHRLDLTPVLPRLRDETIYRAVIDALQSARRWDRQVWGYAVYHRDRQAMPSLLAAREDFVRAAGPVLQSELLTIDPIAAGLYEHLEFAPLVRARIHPLRPEPEILNDRFLIQYRQLLKNLAYQPAPEPPQQLALAYYLLLQNRIEEALERFQAVERDATPMRLQYDYLAAVFALHQGDHATAAAVAARHLDHPVPRWRQRFQEVESQLMQRQRLRSGTELVGDVSPGEGDSSGVDPEVADLAILDRQRRQGDAASRQPAVDLTVRGRELKISHRHVSELTVRFYGVDLELLFSKTPFVQDDLARMATVRPGKTERLSLDQETGVASYRIDESLAGRTLLVEVVAGAARSTALYFGGHVDTFVSEGFGQLQARDAETEQPLAGAYVKVYAKQQDGSVIFYKDGYTDLRGRFDYVSLSANELAQVDQLAILVLDPARGASLHAVRPPTR